jgi:hypothetical protein
VYAIFVSYRRQEAAGWVAYVRQLLEQAFPDEVFIDIESLRPGDWQRQLDDALAACRAFVLVIDPQWLQATDPHGRPRLQDESDVHRHEIEAALARPGGLTVIPVLLGGARLPRADELPPSLAPLLRFQAAELRAAASRAADAERRLLEEIGWATGLAWRDPRAPGSLVRAVASVVAATLASSFAAVVLSEVVFGATLGTGEIVVLTTGLLAGWSAWMRRQRLHVGPRAEGRRG